MVRGQAGEVLVILAILASVVIIVSTVTTTSDTPNVQHETREGLQDVRDLLSRAIVNWLRGGVIEEPLMCNGLYAVSEDQLLAGLEPHVEQQLLTQVATSGDLEITTGTLQDFQYDGLDGFTITLGNGSIIYDDGTVYSADFYDKDYFFNVRLPFALRTVQDWIKCDAGNMSQWLSHEFGEECFYGQKDYRYPGGCILKPKIQYQVDQADRDIMIGQGISALSVAKGTEIAVDELNEYFQGTRSCEEPMTNVDAGITCTAEIEELNLLHEMRPWSSSKIVLLNDVPTSTVNYGQLKAMGDYLDFQDFVDEDKHVYALPAEIITYKWQDSELACDPTGREDVSPGIALPDYEAEPDRVDIATGDFPLFASPILYVNVTRGARFTLKITCSDTQVALLGQPLEYTFRIRHGIKQHCGPPEFMKNGNFQCSGCGLKPGIDTSGCKIFDQPNPCQSYYTACGQSIIWENIYVADPPLFEWKGSDAATIAASEELQQLINRSCDTVWTMPGKWPAPKDERGRQVCPSSFAHICCGTPGYNDTCDPSMSYSNTACYMNFDDYMGFCTADKKCGEDECTVYVCDETTLNEYGEKYACKPSDAEPVGTSCKDDSGCFHCNDAQECVFNEEKEGLECSPGQNDRDSCREWACRENAGDSGACISEPVQPEGTACSSSYIRPGICSDPVCSDRGFCSPAPKPGSNGMRCNTEQAGTCIIESFCNEGYCVPEPPENQECTNLPPPGGCPPGCDLGDRCKSCSEDPACC